MKKIILLIGLVLLAVVPAWGSSAKFVPASEQSDTGASIEETKDSKDSKESKEEKKTEQSTGMVVASGADEDESAEELNKRGNELSEKDPEEAAALFKKAAEMGEPLAMYNLGVCLALGRGVKKDETAAVGWYEKAAHNGCARAMYTLGLCLERGRGVDKDEKKAVDWYKKAAELGEPLAMLNLGTCLEQGRGVEKDETAAVSWYEKAAHKGDAVAMYNLGISLAQGVGVAKDVLAAGDWIAQSAEKGYAQAQTYYGVCLLQGTCGFGVDSKRAVIQFHKAAQQDYYAGLWHLGYCRQKGIGIAKNSEAAEVFFKRAMEQKGEEKTKEWRDANEKARLGFVTGFVLDCSGEVCSICSSSYRSRHGILMLNCSHLFHTICVQTWIHGDAERQLAPHATCPMCRGNVENPIIGTAL